VSSRYPLPPPLGAFETVTPEEPSPSHFIPVSATQERGTALIASSPPTSVLEPRLQRLTVEDGRLHSGLGQVTRTATPEVSGVRLGFSAYVSNRGSPQWSPRTTPANGDEWAQVIPLLDTLHIRTGKRGRPRQRLKVLAMEKGMMPRTSVTPPHTGYPAPDSQPGVEESQTAGETDQKGGPSRPSRAGVCLVAAEVPPIGRALGTSRRVLQRVSCHCRDAHVGS
jgi:hypothetical protein